jgi:hypothetical protein
MEVQTSIAQAKKAEQRAKTVEEEGKANAAQAKWEQERLKAKAVVEAQQKKEVAELERDAASFEKEKQILLGEGEAERKRLVMSADGALAQKLAAWIKAQELWAAAYSKRPVPSVVMGGSGANGTDVSSREFIDMLTIKAAKDLSLDMRTKN